MNCLFCSIVTGDIPSHALYENDQVFAFLDIGPVSEGHTLIVPKVHSSNLAEATPEMAAALMLAVHHLAPAVLRAVRADGYNLGMNHGECAGQDVLHTHLHLMPRRQGVSRSFIKTHPGQEELARVAGDIRAEIALLG